MKRIYPLVASLCLVGLSSCGKDGGTVREAWNPINNPLRLESSYKRTLSQLPKSGQLSIKPWSDSYWPSKQGGIAVRWNSGAGESGFNYRPKSLAELRNMNQQEISRLSPAEKYDIVNGRYDYPTVAAERARTSPSAMDWEGICHGWAPAAYHFSEPKPTVILGANGISVPFGSSDVKALLSLYQGNLANAPSKMLGARCNLDLSSNPSARNNPECRDTNAGSFHVVLTNQIGLMRQSFLADVTRDAEVWNQPIHRFSSEIVGYQGPSAGAAAGTVKEAIVQTVMEYTVEINPSYNATNGTPRHQDARKTYQYRLELNQADEIIGGEWISAERPDFLWTQEKASFSGYWTKLGEIYSISSAGSPGIPTPDPTPVPVPTATPRPQPTPVPPRVTPGPQPSPVPPVTPVPTAIPDPRPTEIPAPWPTEIPDPIDQDFGWDTDFDPIKGVIEYVDQFNNPWHFQCPSGFQLARQSFSGGLLCVSPFGQVATGSQTQTMVELCKSRLNDSECASEQWTVNKYLRFRGNGFCPRGTSFDKETKHCTEGDKNVFGPFQKQVYDGCLSAVGQIGGQAQLCEGGKLKKDFIQNVLGL
jgi:Transglutaminase elicitor